MPNYVYKCKVCGRKFSKRVESYDQESEECPDPGCCGESVRLFIPGKIAIMFKGSGFYSTDNKKTDKVQDE